MSVPIVEAELTIVVVARYCPLCGTVLDPKPDALLCPACEIDQTEKQADHDAELEQARHPY